MILNLVHVQLNLFICKRIESHIYCQSPNKGEGSFTTNKGTHGESQWKWESVGICCALFPLPRQADLLKTIKKSSFPWRKLTQL